MSGKKRATKTCPYCHQAISAKTATCSCGTNFGKKTIKPLETDMKACEKKDRTVKAIDNLKTMLPRGTVINMDNRGDNLSGTGRKYKAIIVQDSGMVNISKDMAHALCIRAAKDGSTMNVSGSVDSGIDLAASTVEMLSKVLFDGDGSALMCNTI